MEPAKTSPEVLQSCVTLGTLSRKRQTQGHLQKCSHYPWKAAGAGKQTLRRRSSSGKTNEAAPSPHAPLWVSAYLLSSELSV